MLKAVIFDMDGVIIDSEPMHSRATMLAMQKYNLNLTQDYIDNFIGSTTTVMCKKIIHDFNLNATCEELLKANDAMKKSLLKAEGHTIVPYVIDLIKDLHRNKMKLIIASSSSPQEIEEVIQSLNVSEYFCGYISGMSVPHTKPAPDIFIAAAEKLNVSTDECIVIEDSYHGVTAASTAGMLCIGYVNPNSGKQDLSKAAILIEGFDEVDYSFMNQIYKSHHDPAEILITNRFIIRELTLSDIPALFEIYHQSGVREYLDDITDYLETELEKHKAYFEVYRYYGYGLWGVFLKDNNLLIGRCGIEYKILDQEEIYELGYLLSTNYQGLGYAQEFVNEVINYCFNQLGMKRIVAVIEKTNTRSIRLAEKLGMICYDESTRNHRECYKYELINKNLIL